MTTSDGIIVRKLAAIVVADVVHYSSQMEADEEGTLARLKALRTEVLDPAMRAHGGRLVKLMGDGLLAEFASAVAAIQWALSVQKAISVRNEAMAEEARMSLRIGVNVGDVILEDDDIYGEGVNVAARLEPLAPRGGICLSAAVHEHIAGKVDAHFTSGGERTVKNIARAVSVYWWSPSPDGEMAAASIAAAAPDAVPWAPRERGRKPSLLVRPFEAAGASSDAAMLASAVHDATIFALSNLTGMTVQTGDARADYEATGTIQAVGQRYRATMRLVDTRSGQQFWSDRFDGDLSDLFDAQDDLAYRVSQSLRFSIYDREVAEMEKVPAAERTTEMILARIGQVMAGTYREEWEAAGPRLDGILATTPDDATARAMKACWHLHEIFYGWRELTDENRAASIAAARRAVATNEKSDFAHMMLSLVHLYSEGDTDRALREAERSLELSPYYSIGRHAQGLATTFGGRPAEGLECSLRTLQANPRMVMNHRVLQAASVAALLLGRHDEALDFAKRSDLQVHDVAPTLMLLAAAAAAGGRDDEAQETTVRLLAMFPDFRISAMRRWPFRRSADHELFVHALAAAGLPA